MHSTAPGKPHGGNHAETGHWFRDLLAPTARHQQSRVYRERENILTIRPPLGQSVVLSLVGLLFLTLSITPMVLVLVGAAKTSGSAWLAFVVCPVFALVGICLLWTERAEIDLQRHLVTFRTSFALIPVRKYSHPLPDEFHIALALWHMSTRRGRVPHARISLEADGVSHCLFDDAAFHDRAHAAAQALSERLDAPLTLTRSKPPLA